MAWGLLIHDIITARQRVRPVAGQGTLPAGRQRANQVDNGQPGAA